mgnify:CR=1 FL=1
MNKPRNYVPINTDVPADCVTLRQAEMQTGISVSTIRGWISEGKGGAKLPTYRSRALGSEIVLVSLRAVERFRFTERSGRRRLGKGGLHVVMQEDDAMELRKLVVLMTNRVGVPIGYREAIRAAVEAALKLEALRVQQSVPEVQTNAPSGHAEETE